MKKLKIFFKPIYLSILGFALPFFSFAQGGVDGTVGNPEPFKDIKLYNPLGENSDIPSILNQVLTWFQGIASIILSLMILWGAWQMLISSGNPENFKKGQKTILWGVIGFIIILIARGIAALVKVIIAG